MTLTLVGTLISPSFWPYQDQSSRWVRFVRQHRHPSKRVRLVVLLAIIIILVILKERELTLFAFGSQLVEVVRDVLTDATFGGEA